jgi:hypothetical protein
MNEIELLNKSINRIHDAAIDVLSDDGLSSQTRKEVCRIAEESLELCHIMTAFVARYDERNDTDSFLQRVWHFLASVVQFLLKLSDKE